jgi:Na+-driven multidrug efflux pump
VSHDVEPADRSAPNPNAQTGNAAAPPRAPKAPRDERLLVLAYPLVISFVLRSAFTFVDRFYAASLEDVDAAQAAIGLAMPFEFLMIACWVGSSNALTSRLATAIGARQHGAVEQLKRASGQLIIALCALFLAISAGIWFLTPHIGLAPEVAEQFRTYATIVVAGSAFTTFWSILPDSIVKAYRDTRTTMWAGIVSSVVNVVLNTVFVFVFHWGIAGIALSTVLGRLGGLFYAQVKAAEHERRRLAQEGEASDHRIPRPFVGLLRIAVPSGLTYVLMSVESFAVNGMLAHSERSEDALAAWSIFDSMLRFLAMPAIACGVAMLPLAAYLRGEGRGDRLRAELRTGLLAILVYTLLVVLPVSLLGRHFLVRQLLEEPGAVEGALRGFLWLTPGALALGLVFLLRPIFDALEAPNRGLAASSVRSLLLVVPATWAGGLLAPQLGFTALDGYFGGFVLGAALGTAWIGWQLRAVIAERVPAQP